MCERVSQWGYDLCAREYRSRSVFRAEIVGAGAIDRPWPDEVATLLTGDVRFAQRDRGLERQVSSRSPRSFR